jgi:hypothetical protein
MGTAVGGLREFKVGAPSHWLRYAVIALAGAAFGGGLWAFQSFSDKRDAAQLAHFQAFRGVWAAECGVPEFVGPQPAIVEEAYLTSTAIQTAMEKARVELSNGASCEDVAHSLKAVDFIAPLAKPRSP